MTAKHGGGTSSPSRTQALDLEMGVAPELQLGRDGGAHMVAAGIHSVDVVRSIVPHHGDQF